MNCTASPFLWECLRCWFYWTVYATREWVSCVELKQQQQQQTNSKTQTQKPRSYKSNGFELFHIMKDLGKVVVELWSQCDWLAPTEYSYSRLVRHWQSFPHMGTRTWVQFPGSTTNLRGGGGAGDRKIPNGHRPTKPPESLGTRFSERLYLKN